MAALAPVRTPRAGRFARLRGNGAALLGFLTGLVYFAGTLYWLVGTMRTFGGLPVYLAVVVCGLLVAFLSLYVALFAWLLSCAVRALGPAGVWTAPLLWTGAEYLRSWIGGGFPWVLLGYSQATVLPVAQAASVAGVFGLSAIVASIGTACAWITLTRRPSRWLVSGAAVACVAGIAVWGTSRIRGGELTSGPSTRVGFVQGNIAQEDKWNPALAGAILTRYIDLSREAIGSGAQVVIWPESSTPFFLEEEPVMAMRIRRLAAEARTPLLIGSDQIERAQPPALTRGADKYYNAAFMVGPDGRTQAVYRKMHLVPFGEYVPLRQLLPFVAPLVEAVSDFTPGTEPVLLPVGDHKLSAAICYEVVYPWLIRSFVRNGSGLLVTITNDAWYGTSSAAYQHWEQASLRAIEQGRYLVRSANTGISGVVDPYGRVIVSTRLFETAVATADVQWRPELTVYARIGDVAAYISLALMVAVALTCVRLKSRHENSIP